MSADGASLLQFLDAPVVVGDPEGRVIYVNPAFEECFALGGNVAGLPFAELFQGGGREAFLTAVARVCRTGDTVQFRLREEGRGYLGVASPIEAAADRVGVIILLSDEPFPLHRLRALQHEIEGPLDELGGLAEEIAERAGALGSRDLSAAAAAAVQAVERARKAVAGLQSLATGPTSTSTSQASLDPAATLRAVARRVEEECAAAGAQLELVAPPVLPSVAGDREHLEVVLLRMLRDRIQQCDRGDRITLAARRVTLTGEPFVVLSIVAPSAVDPAAVVQRVRDPIAALGGLRHACLHTSAGRVTAVPLPLARPAPGA